MSKILMAATLMILGPASAMAADDPMANLYGNTIVSTGGAVTIRTHYRADHTFDFTGSMMLIHRTFKGTWALDDKGTLCRTYIDGAPPETTNPQCTPFVPHKVGDVWRSKDNARTLTLKAGIL